MKILILSIERYPDWEITDGKTALSPGYGYSEEDLTEVPDEKFVEWQKAIEAYNKAQEEIEKYKSV